MCCELQPSAFFRPLKDDEGILEQYVAVRNRTPPWMVNHKAHARSGKPGHRDGKVVQRNLGVGEAQVPPVIDVLDLGIGRELLFQALRAVYDISRLSLEELVH